MPDTQKLTDLAVGAELPVLVRTMTRERMGWYGTGFYTATAGEFRLVDDNIHTDDEFSKAQGLAGIVADGMVSTNWLSGMLLRQFGVHYLERGELLTKYIKPIFEDVAVSSHVQVRSLERVGSGSVIYGLDVWCEDDKGNKLTVGQARVEVTPSG